MMELKRYIVGVFVGLSTSLSVCLGVPSSYPTTQVNGKPYYEYSVEKSEGFYSISKKFGVTKEEIIESNPQTKDGLKVGERLLIPKKTNQTLQHKVQKSETLFSLKQKYGLTYEELYEANPSLKTKGLIEGTSINIPQKDQLLARRDKSSKVTMDNDVAPATNAPEPAHSSATVTNVASETTQQASKPNYIAHDVKQGETLFSISKRYNVSMDEIIRLNPDAKDGVKTGSVLIIPPSYSNTQFDSNGSTKVSELKTHIVAQGETVYSISKKYGVSQESLIARNPGIDKELLAGKMLIIPPVFASNSFQEEEKPKFKTHLVMAGETMFSITHQYGVTEEDITRLNPGVTAETLKSGSTLRIPLTEEEVRTDSISNNMEQIFSAKPKNEINVALAFPWNFSKVTETSPIDATTSKFIEFYNGMLLAADTLRKQGITIDLHVYDSGKTEDDAKKMLEYNELKNMDFIIGPAYASQIKAMADFALIYNVKLCVPFSSKNDEVKSNANIFQINSPQQESAAAVALQVAQKFSKNKIVILTFSDPKYNDKEVWADTMALTLDIMGVEYEKVQFSSLAELRKTISKTKNTLIFPATTNQVALNQVLPIINMLKKNPAVPVNPKAKSKEKEDKDVEILGFSEWQNFQSISKELFQLNTYFTTSFYMDFNSDLVRGFLSKYRHFFASEPSNTQPMYAALGYDIMVYFADAISHYGHDFEWAIDKVKPDMLQTGLKFDRVGEQGGFINTRHYIIESNEKVGHKLFAE